LQPVRAKTELNAHRRRGGIYVLVLGTSILVTVIGVSALALSRIQTRIAAAELPAAKARFAAQSLIEVALLRIANDPNWRSAYTNDTWTDEETVGDAVGAYKLVDELDGDLTNDPTHPVRLCAKATAGEAVRLCSVELTPAERPNLLVNPGFEDGTADWSSWNCTLVTTGDPHRGRGCVFLQGRGTLDSTVYQDVTSVVENGTSYYVEAWVKVAQVGGTEKVTISFKTIASGSGTRIFVTDFTLVGDSWTKVSGTLTPTWTGTLTEARWRVFSFPDGEEEDFFVDDAVMILPDITMTPTPGSWREEVLP